MVHLSGVASTIDEEVFFDRATAHGWTCRKLWFLLLFKRAEAIARADVPTAPRKFSVSCYFEQFHGPS